jgi:hypothetical protein
MPRRLFPVKAVCAGVMLVMLAIVQGTAAPLAFGVEPQSEQEAGATTPAKPTDPAAATDCRQLADLLQQQKNLISRETGQIKREIAALRDDLSRPGIKEIFAGIGYILGLAGVGLYVHCRRSRGQG